MHYLSYDVYSIKTELKDVLNHSVSVAKNTGNMVSSLDHLQAILDSGFDGVKMDLSGISYQLDELLNIMIDINNNQFIQNETRNQLLASIDATLKAPNKTAANEKYEISLELANKNKSETAVKFLKEAIELNPLHYRSYVQLTLNLLKMNEYEDALHYAKESLNFAPENKEVLAFTYSLAARAYEKVKDIEAALFHINQAIEIDFKSDYTYERARYYVLLHDVDKAMSELKNTIENNDRYFALSLMDSVFHTCSQEREQLLISLKQEIEGKMNHALAQLEAVKLHRYPTEVFADCEMLNYKEYYSVVNFMYSGKRLSDCLGTSSVSGYINIGYSYNRLVEGFYEYYNRLTELHNKKLPIIKALGNIDTYSGYSRSYHEFTIYKEEFNELLIGIKNTVLKFKEESATAPQIFKKNLAALNEINKLVMSNLNTQRKWKSIEGLFWGLGTFFVPFSKQHSSMLLKNLEILDERLKMALDEAKKKIENEGMNTKAIKHFTEEVLINKPLPIILE